ncbi:hypothetical protein NMY22_g16904 [Coprinellus aureogranulatus]|nr:hypothetical protein NMY22_g16904 [Coprinellus aureogranulatus]
MPAEDDGNASSSDTHGILVTHDDPAPKKIDNVAVVDKIVQGSPQFGSEFAKDVPTAVEANGGPSLAGVDAHQSDAGSLQSTSAVRMSESPVPMIQEPRSTLPSPSPSTLSHRPPPSPSRSQTLQEPTPNSQQRRASRRSTVEGRSTNRLSGFFTNFIHRREPGTGVARDAIPETTPPPPQSQANSARVSESASRPSSPPPARPGTPPPALPPPSLSELGLSLSLLTSDLSPSHFSTPPTSGAFLAPHYLLLCHAQGLDVLPLVSPPAPQPYALVRRVNFKSVVVMEQRGVLVAIAGRRDGVRVYALEEVKKAIEWRIEVEVKRERERVRREQQKRYATMRSVDVVDIRSDVGEKGLKASLPAPLQGEERRGLFRKASHGPMQINQTPPSPPPVPLVPRPPVSGPQNRKTRSASTPKPMTSQSEPTGQPPPYIHPEGSGSSRPPIPRLSSVSSLQTPSHGRTPSMNNVLSGIGNATGEPSRPRDEETKAGWADSSDDEAIDIVAAGSSGSQALDERTSASLSANRTSQHNPMQPLVAQASPPPQTRNRSGTLRRNRPSNLDLSIVTSAPSVPPPEPSPVPTLLTLRQALVHSPSAPQARDTLPGADIRAPDDEDEDDDDGEISLAQALMESRLPELPPPGTNQPQRPILLSPSLVSVDGVSPRADTPDSSRSNARPEDATSSGRRRRRWSVLLTGSARASPEPQPEPPQTAPAAERSPHRFTRSYSFRSNRSQPSVTSTIPYEPPPASTFQPASLHSLPIENIAAQSSRSSRFLPRILTHAFNHARRSEDRNTLPGHSSDTEPSRTTGVPTGAAPPPKLEYVKLPGTKNAIMIKAVETAKKSFLAILCGDNGEKVELFAGTYRTALGLSRTFILPDSPRSLELQLQGDDLVEVFLVFAQNVFGLEPATVRVREVRIGRAERRAARRRAREARGAAGPDALAAQNDGDNAEDENINIGVTVSVARQPLSAADHPSSQPERPGTPTEPVSSPSLAHPEELLAVASSNTGPYTTFQQLSFAPKFPLASIADEYIIPPTYPSFLKYRAEHEPEQGNAISSAIEVNPTQFSPPGLPVPTPTAPSRWLYRDPKGVVHGPWKASLMQAWYKDGLLPPDLPVRREEEVEFTLLKELRLQCVDPTQPFRSPPLTSATNANINASADGAKPLLAPISLLSQPRHFGPPALFFSSRGGHSTAIVDSRGRSVLKGRFLWSAERDGSEDVKPGSGLGDIRRLEAFDVDERSVLVAMRQGGLEAVDFRDALLRPADESRTVLPNYTTLSAQMNRRPPFVWKIGTPIQAGPAPLTALTHKPKGSGFTSHLTSKRPGTAGSSRGHGKADSASGDLDPDSQEEVFYIGRKEDELYVCERNAGSFRILKLSPSPKSSS